MPPVPKQTAAAKRRAAIVAYARKLAAAKIHEVPAHLNTGPVQATIDGKGVGVRVIQSSTGAYGAPWCVSTGQWIWLEVLGSTWANKTAGVYPLRDYAHAHQATIAKPVPGCGVCYIIGAGHYGTVVEVYPDGTFDAVEGNHTDKCGIVHRNPKYLTCVYVLRPELRG